MIYETIDAQGNTEQLSRETILGRATYTILYFYPKDNTPGCTLEAKEFSCLQEAFASRNVQVIGVSKDSIQSHAGFIKKHLLTPLYISDTTLTLHKQFDARGEKNMYGKIVQGTIRSTYLLDATGNILHQRRHVRAAGHAQVVLARIEQHLK